MTTTLMTMTTTMVEVDSIRLYLLTKQLEFILKADRILYTLPKPGWQIL